MTSAPQRHPSRDPKPNEYTVHSQGTYFKHAGLYGHDELESATAYEMSEGPEGSRSLTTPAQGALFDADKWERAQAVKLGRSRLQSGSYETESTVTTRINQSQIPTSDLQPRRNRWGEVPDSKVYTQEEDTSSYNWQGVGGYYNGPATRAEPDSIAMRAGGGALVHELGHRKHLGTVSSYAEDVNHPRRINPDPLKEGVADAYEDRYGGSASGQVKQMSRDIEFGAGKFPSYQYTGYSTDPDAAKRLDWNPADRALYAATRAHASETGEQALYQPRGRDVREQPGMADFGGGDPTVDATLHHLLSTSPHAAQALRQTGLKQEGAAAFRRHRDRQLLSGGQFVQDSLFHEMRGMESGKVHGYTENMAATPDLGWKNDERILDEKDVQATRLEEQHGEGVWPHHMSHNQFGEAPRTEQDVSHSLGVRRQHAAAAGFTSR